MTHPDIIATERLGGIRHTKAAAKIGVCLYCENAVYDDSSEVMESVDGMFCDMDCCCEYYEIRSACR